MGEGSERKSTRKKRVGKTTLESLLLSAP